MAEEAPLAKGVDQKLVRGFKSLLLPIHSPLEKWFNSHAFHMHSRVRIPYGSPS